jgi:hypothetical protein
MRRLAIALGLLLLLAGSAGGSSMYQGQVFSAVTATTSLSVGATPTAITQIRVYSQTITPGQIAAAAGFSEQTFTVSGLTTADKVVVNVGAAPTALCEYVGRSRVSAVDTLALSFFNSTAALCTPAAGTWNIVAVRS